MPNVVFFRFTEADRGVVLTIKGRAVNSNYSNLNFRVKDGSITCFYKNC